MHGVAQDGSAWGSLDEERARSKTAVQDTAPQTLVLANFGAHKTARPALDATLLPAAGGPRRGHGNPPQPVLRFLGPRGTPPQRVLVRHGLRLRSAQLAQVTHDPAHSPGLAVTRFHRDREANADGDHRIRLHQARLPLPALRVLDQLADPPLKLPPVRLRDALAQPLAQQLTPGALEHRRGYMIHARDH